ncbi:MAG: PAS domain S-box protein [Flavipsychrobacter sp.]|nr:PAS domain S-box protein [Flavipsychrobacter sp.]
MNQAQRLARFGSWELDLSTGISVWSEEACRIHGLEVTNNVHNYDEWEAMVHPDDLSSVRGSIEFIRNNQTSVTFDCRIVRPDGEVRNIHCIVECEYTPENTLAGIYGVTQDVTESLKATKDLKTTEVNLQLILDLIPLSIYARQSNGDYIFGNHVFLGHYGITAEQLRGKNLRDFVRSEAEYLELSAQDQLVLSSGKKLIVSDFRQKDHHGVEKIWRIIKIPYIPKGQTEHAVLGIAEDITTQKQKEENILQMSEVILERNKELEQFSMMVSHDLRGPLATIMGVSDVIDGVHLTQDDLSVFIGGIRTALMRLDEIVRRLNDITSRKDE